MRRIGTVAIAGLLVLGGCATADGDAEPTAHPSSSAAPAPGSSPTLSPSPDPRASGGPAVALPEAAARRWSMPADPALGLDLGTPGRIVVRAGCLGFTGDLLTSAPPDDPAAGATAGPTVTVRITPRDDGRVHCLGFTAEQQEFVAALRGATVLTVVGDSLSLSGPSTTLDLVAAS